MSLAALFAPRAVAVLGVSRNPAKLGFRLLENVKARGFTGAVHPVNPAGEAILGYETVRHVEDLPSGVDLALVSLPAPAVPDAIKALAARGVRAAVILSSGFGEVDAEGRTTQAELLATARAAGLRLVGPNCMGVYSAPARLNGTYFWDLPTTSGGIAVVSQSGAYGGLIFRHLGGRGLGVARFLSIGNQVDVDIAEVIEYLVDDPDTTLIACFVEALRDGRRFVRAAERAAGRTPVVVLKGGRSDAGRRAAGSHTGSLAGSYDVFRAACVRARIVLADETEEFFDAIETLTIAGARRPAAPHVAVVTVSGGPSVVAADTAERAGLRVPALSESVRTTLRAQLPSFAAVGNPVDLTPQVDPARVDAAVRAVMTERDIAGAVVVDVGLDIPAFADAVVAAVHATDKPAVAFAADAPRVIATLVAGGVAVLPSPERAVRAWRALWQARASVPPRVAQRAAISAPVAAALAHARGALPYVDARRLLEAYGVRFCREAVAASIDEAVAAAQTIGYPVVMKADVPGLTHKTDAGGVVLDVAGPDAVRAAWRGLAARTGATRFVVQERVGPGVELLVGARRDDVFGPVVVLGMGGVLTEVVQDISVRLAPVADDECHAMLEEGARPRLLAGPRGLPPVDRTALATLVARVSDCISVEARVREIDLNPVIATGADLVAVDALVFAEES
ncbi:MAG: acetate--CoA ligase family protein [Candidatus Rokubacteria bacterium]|nr:acetate--CoA ligase family protein [Candidatus Rokubacteria bacterium]